MIVFDGKLKPFFPLLLKDIFNDMPRTVFTFVDQVGFFCGMEQMRPQLKWRVLSNILFNISLCMLVKTLNLTWATTQGHINMPELTY